MSGGRTHAHLGPRACKTCSTGSVRASHSLGSRRQEGFGEHERWVRRWTRPASTSTMPPTTLASAGREREDGGPTAGSWMRFLYFYLMKDAPERVRAAAPKHAAYWRELRLGGYLGGPFADRSGGLITFETDSAAQAEALVANDPFLREGLLERHWVKQWLLD
jgi:uncharacterized protein YciI